MVSLTEVAEACGVSPSTVSRALFRPDMVNAKTRQRILYKAEEMGYQLSRNSPSVPLGRTKTLGLIVSDISNPFFPPIIKAIQARASQKSIAVLLADTDEHISEELECARLMSERADGMILVSPRTPDEQLGNFLELGPVVFVNRQVEHAPSVLIEGPDGINQAVEHLAALGHRKICYLAGPRQSWSNRRRREFITAACQVHDVELIEFGPFEPQIQAGVRAVDLLQAAKVTAVIAYDDLIAFGVMARLAERGVRTGRDISVIGIDDSPMSGLGYPTLTSIHTPGEKAGAIAVDLLLKLLSGQLDDVQMPIVELETYLVVRSSTAAAT